MSSLPFQQLQQQMCARIRNPDHNPMPETITTRQMEVYEQLCIDNLDSTLSNTFPVLQSVIDRETWQQLVCHFLRNHLCQSPYFHHIGKEFIQYIKYHEQKVLAAYPFFLELAHYEWLELDLELAQQDINEYNYSEDILNQTPVLSPLAWLQSFQFPVHKISKDFTPNSVKTGTDKLYYLLIYRNRQHQVNFMELNHLSAQLYQLLKHNHNQSGTQLLSRLAQIASAENHQQFKKYGYELYQNWLQEDILLGAKP